MIPYGRHTISPEDIDAVVEVLRSDHLTQGPVVPAFEEEVAKYCGSQFGIAMNSATSALHAACLALGLGSGDILWTSVNTFVASANCAIYCGASVDFVDVDPPTGNLSVEALAQKLQTAEALGKLPKILIVVHFAGQPCDMYRISALSRQYGFIIIEDASHAIGASYWKSDADSNDGWPPLQTMTAARASSIEIVKVGSCKHSSITVFSFHPVKNITSGEGGMAVCNDADLASRMERIRSHGITRSAELMDMRPSFEQWNYQQIELGFNYRMSDIHAALGLSQMKRLDDFIESRHRVAQRYGEALRDSPFALPKVESGRYSSFHLYPIRIQVSSGLRQKEVYRALIDSGIGVNVHYIPVHRHPFYEHLGFKLGDFPGGEAFHREAISLPIFAELTFEQQDRVLEVLSSIASPSDAF